MRWLRCLLSREFETKHSLVLWDYIFGGIESSHRADRRCRGADFLEGDLDPLIGVDYLCTAMIVNIKSKLLEGDFGMCMSYLLNYEGPSDPVALVKEASRIRQKLKDPPEVKNANDYFENLKRLQGGKAVTKAVQEPISQLCVSGRLDDPLADPLGAGQITQTTVKQEEADSYVVVSLERQDSSDDQAARVRETEPIKNPYHQEQQPRQTVSKAKFPFVSPLTASKPQSS